MKRKISDNLRKIRTLRNMKQAELAAKLTILSGEQVTALQVSRWERGERTIPAHMIGYAAQALHTSAQGFYDYKTTQDDKRLLLEYAALPEREKNILRYIVSGWDGDTHALVHWLAMYVSVRREKREAIAGTAVQQYTVLRREKHINPSAPEPDMEYLLRACDALIKKQPRAAEEPGANKGV